jgi:hypothetical protein
VGALRLGHGPDGRFGRSFTSPCTYCTVCTYFFAQTLYIVEACLLGRSLITVFSITAPLLPSRRIPEYRHRLLISCLHRVDSWLLHVYRHGPLMARRAGVEIPLLLTITAPIKLEIRLTPAWWNCVWRDDSGFHPSTCISTDGRREPNSGYKRLGWRSS